MEIDSKGLIIITVNEILKNIKIDDKKLKNPNITF